MPKEVFKYQCPTNREDNGCFRQACTLCNCAPFSRMVLDPGKVISNEETEHLCPHTNEPLKLVDAWIELDPIPTMLGSRMSENQVRSDRMKRSTEHFETKVLKGLPKEDRRILTRNKKHLRTKKDKL